MNTLEIHYDDEYILVVEKESGLPTVPVKNGKRPTLADLLIEKYPDLSKIGKKDEAGIVHRLDNQTSGLILVAKDNETYEILRKQILSPSHIKKEYLALVLGGPPKEESVTSSIAHHPRKKKKMVISKFGRSAITHFKVIKRYVSKNHETSYALLQIEIQTGVRHQIRSHMASLGFPLAGDNIYQNIKKKRQQDVLGLKRQFLHASKLGFTHPKTGKWMEVSSKLPFDLKRVLKQLTAKGD